MKITNEEGIFTKMVKKNGEKGAQEIFEKAYTAYKSSNN